MRPLLTGHEDLVQDIAYDFYGKRIATCSADHHIKVFDSGPGNGSWVLSDSWKAHDSAVSKIVWAVPEFGQVIASCSYDRSVRIFEEDRSEQHLSGRRWKRRAVLSNANGPVYDIALAPSNLGLRLGAISSDGFFRIYDALEPNDLRSWTCTAEVNILSSPPARQLQSAFGITWCPSKFSAEKLVVCALDQGLIYMRDSRGRLVVAATLNEHQGLIRDVAWAPSLGRTFDLLATGSKDGYVRIYKITNKSTVSREEGGRVDSVSESVEDTKTLESGSEVDIVGGESQVVSTTPLLNVELIAAFDDHKGEVWRVSWNFTGTVLSSAGDDGKVRLWKSSYSNEFQCMSVISTEQQDAYDEDQLI